MSAGIAAACAAALLLAGCRTDRGEDAHTFAMSGTIRHMDFEGGFYGIVTDSGQHLLPENLQPEFQKDSLRVSFEGRITNRPTTVMWGRTITLTRIRALP
jgi:hypothetical protein